MKQKLILLALVIGLTIVSQSSLSLGMGKIQVYSALNEPLVSSIDLLVGAEEDLENITVSLASSADYQKVGLDKSFVPANIMVAFDDENPSQINVTSNGPVTEPIVSLLLDVNWANGRILREFTILLDPPAYETNNVSAQVNDVEVAPMAEAVAIEPVTEEAIVEPAPETTPEETYTYTNEDFESTSEPVAIEQASNEASAVNSVTVNSGDTLWRIAFNNKFGDLTTHQMMMAIYNANPDAFGDNNINQLIKGSRLNMPSADEARSIGLSEALAQVESHNQSWAPASTSYAAIQTATATEDVYEPPASNLDFGVQLSGSDSENTDNGQSNTDSTDTEVAMAVEEDLLTKDTENTELKERISELEDIVEQQQEVLEIADDSLANLENQLSNVDDETIDNAVDTTANVVDDVWDTATENAEDAGEALALNVDGVAEETTSDEVNTGGFDDLNDVEETDVATVENEVVEEVAETTPVVTRPKREEQSFINKAMDWVMGNLMWVLIGLGALLALIFVPKLLSGGSDDDEDGGSFLDEIKSKPANNDADAQAETKMNEPLVEDDPEPMTADEDDVLAELDKSISFEDDDMDADIDADVENDFEEDVMASADDIEKDDLVDADDGFDLDGFLNDENTDSMSDTVDHSETLAGVDFDEDEAAAGVFDEDDIDKDDDFSLDDLSLDDEAEDVITEIEQAADDSGHTIAEGLQDLADDKTAEDDEEFNFDDNDFDFDLDEELDELENTEDIDALEKHAAEAEETTETLTDELNLDEDLELDSADEFNDQLELSDDDQDAFETIDTDDDMEDEIDLGLEDLLEDNDAIGTKLDLAKAYLDMGDADGAKNLLDEVFAEGSEEQIEAAKKLLDGM